MTAKNNQHKLPAGPSLYQSLKGARNFINDPIKVVSRNMERYAGTFTAFLGFTQRVIITQDAAFIQHVLKEYHRNYSKSPLATEKASKYLGNGILFSNGEYWLRQRRMIQPAFHREKLQGLNGIIIKAINDSLATFPTGKSIDICPFMHRITFTVLIRSLFDIPLTANTVDEIMGLFADIQEFLMQDAAGLSKLFYFFTRKDSIVKKKSMRLRSIIRAIIRKAKSDKKEHPDLLHMLLDSTYEDSGQRMSEDQIIDEIMILIFAGHETAANTLSWLLYLLASNEPFLQQLTASLLDFPTEQALKHDFLKATINEGMRLYPAAWMTERVAVSDDAISGYSFPKGTVIISFLYGLQRDDSFWENAASFNPQRFVDDPGLTRSSHFYPFGAGPRLCIGNNYAMAEMSFFLAAFFQQFNIKTAGHIPHPKARITLKPDKVMLNITRR